MRIVVLGAGESGAGAAVLAKVKGFDTFVSDMSAIKDKYKELLDKYGIAWEEGHHTEELILNADEVVKSPGIPNDAPLIMKLKEKGTRDGTLTQRWSVSPARTERQQPPRSFITSSRVQD